MTSQPVAPDMTMVRMVQWIDSPRKVFSVSATQTPAIETIVDAVSMYPKVVNTEADAPKEGPKALPVKVTNEPADGVKRENCAIVLVRNRITTIAVRMVKGAASPAPCTIIAKPKKKLIAGAMLARVDATVWPRESS